MRTLIVLTFLALFFTFPVLGEDIDLSSSIYWDANIEADMDVYGVYRSDTPCTDPIPTPVSCPTFVEVASIPQASSPIEWVEPGPITFLQDYYYRVSARNTSGNESGLSNELNIRWLNPDAPAIPGDPRTLIVAAIIINGNNNTIVANFMPGHEPMIIRIEP